MTCTFRAMLIACLYRLGDSSDPSSFTRTHIKRKIKPFVNTLRGGSNPNPSSYPLSSQDSWDTSSPYPPPTTTTAGIGTGIEQDNEPYESVEDRIAAWRSYQQHRYEQLSPMDASNPREEDGRMKLLASVSRGSIAIFFFVLMWRSVHHFELADQSFRGTTRLLFVLPTVGLFIGNMAGCVAAITSPTNSAKKRMKAILNLNKIVELLILMYNLFRYVFFALYLFHHILVLVILFHFNGVCPSSSSLFVDSHSFQVKL